MKVLATWLWSAAYFSSLVQCRFKTGGLAQAPLGSYAFQRDIDGPLTVNIDQSVTVSRPAELATLYVSIHTSGQTEDAARQKALLLSSPLVDHLHKLSTGEDPAVEDWSLSRSYTSQNDMTYDDMYFRQRKDMFGDDDADDRTSQVQTRFTIPFNDLEALKTFTGHVTNASHTQIDSVKWRLSEETAKAAKTEARAEAVQQMMYDGKDYAQAFGFTSAKALAVEELHSYFDYSDDEWYYYGSRNFEEDEAGNLRVPKIKTHVRVQCKMGIF